MLPIMGPRLSAIEEWEGQVRQVSQLGEQIVQLLTRVDLVYTVNDLATKISATDPGAVIDGGTYTKEQAQAIVAMLASFEAWLGAPLGARAPTPKQIMFRR